MLTASTTLPVLLLAVSGLLILTLGTRLTRSADRLAEVSGLGQAAVGTVLLGAVTSASGSVTSVTAALDGHPQLALSNAFGGIAGQTVFLVLADLLHRRANLEHAAASVENIISGVVLIALLSMLLAARMLPPVTLLGVHPVSVLLVLAYVFAVRLSTHARREAPWIPQRTDATYVEREAEGGDEGADTPGDAAARRREVWRLGLEVIVVGVVVSVVGVVVAKSALALAAQAGLSEGFTGAVLTALVTSSPELVTTLAAVRRGALNLAVGGILGGNTFDVLFAAMSDVAYRDGSAYHEMGDDQHFLVLVCVLMTATLLLGLLRRERHGFYNIGWESAVLLGLYVAGIAGLVLAFPAAA